MIKIAHRGMFRGENKDGEKKRTVELIASNIVLLGSPKERKQEEYSDSNRPIDDNDIPF